MGYAAKAASPRCKSVAGNGPAIMLIAVVGAVCVAVAALGRKVKKEREMATWH